MAKLTLIKFGSLTCPACIAMDKAKTLERLAETYPGEVEIIKLDVADAEGEAPTGTSFDTAYKLSDEYEVQALPTIIVETADGGELDREEGGMSFKQLSKMFEEAKERATWAGQARKLVTEQADEIRRSKIGASVR